MLRCVAGLLPLLLAGASRGESPLTPLDPLFALLWLAGVACAIGAALQAKFHRLAALILVGGVGLITCLTFAWFSAPDLALTQIAVEVVTLVLILLGLRWLPKRLEIEELRRRTLRRARCAARAILTVAVIAGGGIAALTFAVLTRAAAGELAPFFLSNALEQAGGRNVVNVMLVDFRGFDTFGEITVVGIVAIIVYALLRRFRPAPESMTPPHSKSRADRRGDGARARQRSLAARRLQDCRRAGARAVALGGSGLGVLPAARARCARAADSSAA